ncbi:hypothetical protein BGZ63DRAFT_373822 [Mariannaea sp. PMI_226]|nr:hypothetical protein BGZ63DRAFT_373822 [Mariannaea sp. PMI_226]
MRTLRCSFRFLFLYHLQMVQSLFLTTLLRPTTTLYPWSPTPSTGSGSQLQERDIGTRLTTCGYLNGNPQQVRTAELGWDCRIDTRNGLWGFCPTTVIVATDCGIAGSCVDQYDCSEGCGLTNEGLPTVTWLVPTELLGEYPKESATPKARLQNLFPLTDRHDFSVSGQNAYCSTALLTFGVDQTYSYIGCGVNSFTEHYEITPRVDAETTTTATSEEPDTSTTLPETLTAEGTTTYIAKPTFTSERSSTVIDDNAQESETSSPASKSPSTGGSPTNTGAIIGGVIGGLVLICLTVVAAIYLQRRNNGQSSSPKKKYGASQERFSLWRLSNKPKDPLELAGWGPRELAGSEPPELPHNGHFRRQEHVELAG